MLPIGKSSGVLIGVATGVPDKMDFCIFGTGYGLGLVQEIEKVGVQSGSA